VRTVCLIGLLALPLSASAGARMGGYVRVMARPDTQGGMGRLGYWNLYGRLLNEGPYAALNFDVDVLEPHPGANTPWTRVHMQIEGGSVGGMDPDNGSLAMFRLSQLHILAGNVLLPNVTWQTGTLESSMGDLGLYDMRPATLFSETVGMSARWEHQPVDLLVGIGDSGFAIHGERYNPVLTLGGSIRVAAGSHVQLGLGGQMMTEPSARGNRNAPYDTPGVGYQEWVRGETLQNFRSDHPIAADRFPQPLPAPARSHKLIAYLGAGDWGPLQWNSTYLSVAKLHPDPPGTETYMDETVDIHVTSLTDERTVLQVGNEMLLSVVPERLDAAWGVLYGDHTDADNDILPSDHDRSYASTVLRLQLALTPTVGLLTESSLAREWSRNGNQYREHKDSIFANTEGAPDTRGLETGDADTRRTWQGKTGVVFTPLGPGIWTRPTLRLLYGTQWSSQNNAFSNSFVDTVDQYNEFGNVEQHWHHVIALEAEAWF